MFTQGRKIVFWNCTISWYCKIQSSWHLTQATPLQKNRIKWSSWCQWPVRKTSQQPALLRKHPALPLSLNPNQWGDGKQKQIPWSARSSVAGSPSNPSFSLFYFPTADPPQQHLVLSSGLSVSDANKLPASEEIWSDGNSKPGPQNMAHTPFFQLRNQAVLCHFTPQYCLNPIHNLQLITLMSHYPEGYKLLRTETLFPFILQQSLTLVKLHSHYQ